MPSYAYVLNFYDIPSLCSEFTFQSNELTFLDRFNASLNLSFIPLQPNSYAFVNRIEIFSVPNNLYYTSANQMELTLVNPSYALETEYRINVGGKQISARNNTGLFRVYTGHDENYLMTQNLKDNLPLDNSGRNITVNPYYMAPKELYRTTRDMSINTTLNKSPKLTLEFPIFGCCHMVRFHFCELGPNIHDIDERIDVLHLHRKCEGRYEMESKTKIKGLPLYKDYIILIHGNDAQKKFNLSLQIFPYESDNHRKHNDLFLNDLEIFKISKPQHIVTEGKSNNIDKT